MLHGYIVSAALHSTLTTSPAMGKALKEVASSPLLLRTVMEDAREPKTWIGVEAELSNL